MHVRIEPQRDAGLPEFDANLSRVNAIMGSNGSGKTRLLIHLAQNAQKYFGTSYAPVLIEGSRRLNFDVTVGDERGQTNFYGNPTAALQAYNSSKGTALDGRLKNTFKIMRAMEFAEKGRHSDAVHDWEVKGGIGKAPSRQVMPFEILFRLFTNIFPHLRLEITESHQLYVRNDTAHYPIISLSDGEQQLLAFLSDLLSFQGEKSVFLVDEPELRLHPKLADSLWDEIEAHYSDSIFVYATHSVAFALRKSVDAVHVLGHGEIDLREAEDPPTVLSPFLGSLPGIVRKRRCLFVEGDDSSFDATFYLWLLSDAAIEVIAVGSASSVRIATNRGGIWGNISPNTRVGGIVDRDFRAVPDHAISGLVTLDLHEAESYLCHPDLVAALSARMASTVLPVSPGTVTKLMQDSARKRLAHVVAQRVTARIQMGVRPSVQRSRLIHASTLDEVAQALIEAVQSETDRTTKALAPEEIRKLVDEEGASCNAAIDSGSTVGLLQLFEGKQMIKPISQIAGCSSVSAMLRASKAHIAPTEFSYLADLSNQLKSIFA